MAGHVDVPSDCDDLGWWGENIYWKTKLQDLIIISDDNLNLILVCNFKAVIHNFTQVARLEEEVIRQFFFFYFRINTLSSQISYSSL